MLKPKLNIPYKKKLSAESKLNAYNDAIDMLIAQESFGLRIKNVINGIKIE